MRYEGKSLFECVRCPMCVCRQLSPYGNFTVGLEYAFDYIIDARKVTDNLEEIKAYAKTMNVNYLQAKRALTQKRNLIAAGRAYDIWKMLVRLEPFSVHHEIDPEYPYG